MRDRAREAAPTIEREAPESLRPLYEVRHTRSVSAVRAAVAALSAESRKVTLAAIEQVSRGLPEGAVSAKTVLRNPECRALYVAATGGGTRRITRSSKGALRAELSLADDAGSGVTSAAASITELRRA